MSYADEFAQLPNDPPPHLDAEERLLWKTDGFARSLLRRVAIARAIAAADGPLVDAARRAAHELSGGLVGRVSGLTTVDGSNVAFSFEFEENARRREVLEKKEREHSDRMSSAALRSMADNVERERRETATLAHALDLALSVADDCQQRWSRGHPDRVSRARAALEKYRAKECGFGSVS